MKYEKLVGKPVNWLFLLVLAYTSLLPAVFSWLSYWKIRYSRPAVFRFSETFGRKMNSCKVQLWDRLNHQESSSGLPQDFPFLKKMFFLFPAHFCNGLLCLSCPKLNFGWCLSNTHMGHWHKAISLSRELKNSEPPFCLLAIKGNCPSSRSSAVFIGGWYHTTPCLHVDKNFWTHKFFGLKESICLDWY